MAYYISKLILYLWGWKIQSDFPKDKVKKCIFIMAPHTSYWDFVIGRFAFWYLRVNPKFLIKAYLFKGPMNPLLRSLGAVPVEQSNAKSLVYQVVSIFNKNENFYLLITPEGTRKYVKKWKLGFYHIAQTANVPVYMCYMDYKNKRGGIGPELKISGNVEKDFIVIEDFYKTMNAKYPEKFNFTSKPN